MPTTMTEADFAVLLARSGISLPDDQRAGLLAVWDAVEAMRQAVRVPAEGAAPLSAAAAAAEPAVIYLAERGA